MTMTSIHSWNVIRSSYLTEELADAPVLVHPDDRFSEEGRDRQHLQRRAELFGGGGNCVRDDKLFHISFPQPVHRVTRQAGMRGHDEHPVPSLLRQRGAQVGYRAARWEDVFY